MAQVYKCTFNNVNGENTGVHTRTSMTKYSPSPKILYRKDCPDGYTFYADPNVGGTNTYYKLIDPEKYGINSGGNIVYVPLLTKHLSSWTLIDEKDMPTSEPKEPVTTQTETKTAPPPIVPGEIAKINSSKIEISSNRSNTAANIYTTESVSLYESIKKYTDYVTNSSAPKIDGKYNFKTDYSPDMTNIDIIERNLNIGISKTNANTIRNDMLTRFNRFLIAFPDLALSKTFAHVFFTRPALNLYTDSSNMKLLTKVDNDPYFYFLNRNNPELLKSLTSNFSSEHDFNPYLSNVAGSFELKDEFIETNDYGETLTGWKIKYGKHNIKSKTADSFSINYTDDNNYNVYKIHKAWTDYISKVYRGEFDPNSENVRNRTLDYAVSVYFFLCGPDGETILFWSKYTGVFPTNTPSSASSWTKGNIVKLPEFSINYEFSWKEDMMPTSLAEFNLNSISQSKYAYAKTYEPELRSTGRTFVDAPFIETRINKQTQKYDYILRFRSRKERGVK